MAPQGALLLSELPIMLSPQGPGLCVGALGPRLLPRVDDVHAPGNARLHDAGELVTVAGHIPTLRRPRPAWHPRPERT